MRLSIKKWKIHSEDKEVIEKLCNNHEISRNIANLLKNRDVSDENIEEFLWGKDLKLSDPLSYIDMEKARDRINLAIERFEKTCIYGDYDVGARRF